MVYQNIPCFVSDAFSILKVVYIRLSMEVMKKMRKILIKVRCKEKMQTVKKRGRKYT